MRTTYATVDVRVLHQPDRSTGLEADVSAAAAMGGTAEVGGASRTACEGEGWRRVEWSEAVVGSGSRLGCSGASCSIAATAAAVAGRLAD